MIRYAHASPIGDLTIYADDTHITGLYFEDPKYPPREEAREGSNKVVTEARRQLDKYFAGKLREFDLPLKPEGTDFQLKVWKKLSTIPYGVTWSYGDLAKKLGAPQASRAVGAANGRNPIPVIVPCHRVIGANGTLTGFGGGIPRKKFLLELEGRTAILAA